MNTAALPPLLKPAETAEALGVDVKTLARWAKAGRIPHVWTIGGHRRYPRDLILALAQRQGSGVRDDDLARLEEITQQYAIGKT